MPEPNKDELSPGSHGRHSSIRSVIGNLRVIGKPGVCFTSSAAYFNRQCHTDVNYSHIVRQRRAAITCNGFIRLGNTQALHYENVIELDINQYIIDIPLLYVDSIR